MSEFDPGRNANNNNNDAWNEVEAMARNYNKTPEKRAELNKRTMESIAKNKHASKVFKKLASGVLSLMILSGAGVGMGIAAGNVVAEQIKEEQLNTVTNSITTFIDENSENKPYKIYTQPIDNDGAIHSEKTLYHDDVNKDKFSEQLEELDLARSKGVAVEWMNEDNVYTAYDVDCDGSWNIVTCTNVNDAWEQGPYFMADDKTGEEIPESWSTMTGVEQYFAENNSAE